MKALTLRPAWLHGYAREWLRADLIAGLTAAAVVIPKAMAYATIAGLPLQVGLFTVFVPMVVYALLGTSPALSVSTTTTIAILSAAALGEAVPGADAGTLIVAGGTLAALVGAMLLLASAARLGFLANFISQPVLAGFKSGIALVIVLDQVPKLLGIHIHKAGFLRDVLAIAEQLPQTSGATLVLAVCMLLVIFGLERFLPRAPAPLIAVGLGIAASLLLALPEHGVETVGLIPQDFPRFAWPQPRLVAELWPAAAGIALMSFTESIAAARAFAQASEPRPAPNRELLALGLANAAGGLLGAMPSGGGTTQTAVNRRAGARTQLAELVTAGAAVATLLFLAPLLSLMPAAVLAAVVVAYSVELFKPAEFAELRRVRHIEFRWAIIACAGVVFLGTLRGILVAVIASLVALAHQAYNPPVYVLGRKRGSSAFRPLTAADQTWPGLLILRTEGRMFFANAPGVGERMYALIHAEHPSVVVLDCSAIPDIEYTALEMLAQADEKLRADGVELWLAALNPEPFAMVNRSRLGQALGRTRIFFSLEMALYKWESRDGRQAKA